MKQIRTPNRVRQAGLSLIELLVGVAIGLFIVGGAVKLTVENLVSNRRLLIETRVNQDLRAAADVIARDLRRASYWDAATSGLWSAGAPSVSAVNPYVGIDTSVASTVTYTYQRPTVDATTSTTLANTSLGFRLTSGVLEVRNAAGGWQALTDSRAVNVTQFTITPTTRTVDLWPFCSCRTRIPVSSACTDTTLAASSTVPKMIIREYQLLITGKSATGQASIDDAVVRQVRETVRVRNDELQNPNGCPAA